MNMCRQNHCEAINLDYNLIGKEFVHFKGGRYRLVGYAKDSKILRRKI